MKLISALAVLAVLVPSAAFADGTLMLKANPTDADGRITIGDVFDGATPGQDGIVLGYRNAASTVLDAATVQMVAARNGLSWDNPRGLRRIIVSAGSNGSAPLAAMPAAASALPASATVAAVAQAPAKGVDALVFAHAMNAGDVVQPDDMTYAKVPAVSGDVPSDASTVIGKAVRYPVREGAVIHASALMAQVVIKRADSVKVTWLASGISLSVTGIAQKDAAAGDAIQVQNPTSKKMIDAVVIGPGEAVAGPGADPYRSRTIASR